MIDYKKKVPICIAGSSAIYEHNNRRAVAAILASPIYRVA